ncbi:MAG: L,D-transpeptidase [Methylovirgula sp.]|nr:L,D-transpeptidase [Methylovirgula sp.]
MSLINRRNLLSGAAAAGASFTLAGCVSTQSGPGFEANASVPQQPTTPPPAAPSPALIASADEANGPIDYAAMYSGAQDGTFEVPPVKLSQIKKGFMRKLVDYQTVEQPGTIVVDPAKRYLYHVLPNGKAMRYGVGVGREGFLWSGTAEIHSKQEWPDWYPPKEMIAREPELRKQLDQLQSGIGMHGGPRNPLGARAMYLWQGDKDTLYRIHGTVEPWSIGTNASSGCIRMINQDVIDLYAQTPVGTKVVVLGHAQPKMS